MKSTLRKTAAAMSALSLGAALAFPAAAQVGDSKPDPRSFAQGVTDNPNTSNNPVGVPHSTNAERCAALQTQDHPNVVIHTQEYAACMENLTVAPASNERRVGMWERWRNRNASSGAGARAVEPAYRPAPAADAYRGAPTEGVTDNPNTSANPNTGGDGYRGGDSGIPPQGGE